jgi:hypothetical protein
MYLYGRNYGSGRTLFAPLYQLVKLVAGAGSCNVDGAILFVFYNAGNAELKRPFFCPLPVKNALHFARDSY